MPKIKNNISAEDMLVKILSDELAKSIDKSIMDNLKTMSISARKIKIGNMIIKINEMVH